MTVERADLNTILIIYSLSTYGVVKPAGMRVHLHHSGGGTGSTRNRRKQRHRARTGDARIHSPPPSYSKVDDDLL